MPACSCVTYNCGGTIVEPRTFRNHRNLDQKAAFHAAERNTQATVDSQIEDITAYLSASVLADEVSGPLQTPGGSLWSRPDSSEDYLPQDKSSFAPEATQARPLSPNPSACNSHLDLHRPNPNQPSSHCPPRQPGSRRSCEAEILASLADIEVEVDALKRKASEHLAHVGRPSSSGPPPPFPLRDLSPLFGDLKSRLETISHKGPAVSALKNSILNKLRTIELGVTTARKVWKEELADIKAAKTPQHGLPYETGNLFLESISLNSY